MYMRGWIGLLVFVVACGDDPDSGPVDAPEVDAPEVDAPAIDGPPIDVPSWVGDGPPPQYCVTNAECLPDTFCRLAIASYCRHGFQPAVCQPRPASCPPPEAGDRPVCGCAGGTYASECEAFAGGESVGPGGCADQASLFNCGDTFCARGTEYCAELRYNDDIATRDWECRPLPTSADPCVTLMAMDCPGMGHPVPGGIAESCGLDDAGEVFYMCYVRWT